MKAITLVGSTGSIGTQTLDIVTHHPDQFRIVGLAAGNNVEMLAAQIRQFRPKIAAIYSEEKLPAFSLKLSKTLIPNLFYWLAMPESWKLPVTAMPKQL